MGDASRRFTLDEDRSVAERYVAGESIAQLAKAFVCSDVMIRHSLDKSGIKRRPQKRKHLFSDDVEAEICRRYVAGESSDALAIAYNTNGRTILNIIERGKVVKRLSASAMNPVVTEETRRAIVDTMRAEGTKSLHEQGTTYAECAMRFGISIETVRRCLRGESVSLYVGRTRTHTVNDAAFNALTPESLYWIGFLFADGCVHEDEHGSPKLVVGLSSVDRAHLEKLRMFLGSTHKITDRPPHDSKPTYKGGPIVKTGSSCYLSIRSTPIFDALTTRGMVTKAARVPPSALAESRDFWRGAVDGDGSIGINSQQGKYAYPSVILAGQLPLLDKFAAFLVSNGLPELEPYWGDGVWSIGTTGSFVKDIVRVLYQNASIVLDRKARRAVCILHDCKKLSSENDGCCECFH